MYESTLLLSGNSETTQPWIEEVAATVREECAVEKRVILCSL